MRQLLLLISLVWFSAISPSLAKDLYMDTLSNSDTILIEYHPIGEFHTSLTPQKGAPRQGVLVPENKGTIEIYQEYQEALKDLEACEYIIVLYHMHMSSNWHSSVRPPNSNRQLGLFATRSPNRPNSIGFAVIKLHKVDGAFIHVSGIDAFDGTPVLDIKPWLPSIDCPEKGNNQLIEKEVGLSE